MKCKECNGEGGFIHLDGLSAHSCKKCKGTGITKEMIEDAYGTWFKEANEFNELGFVGCVQYPSSLDIFIAGTDYAIQQMNNDAVEFAQWIVKNNWTTHEGLWRMIGSTSIVKYTSYGLHQLYLSSKMKEQ
jgi:hypothetical protein